MSTKKGYLYIVVTIIMFTSYEVVLKFISGQLNSMQLTLCRFAVGFVILLPLALHTLKKRGERLDGKSMAHFALLGLLGIALSMPILHVSVNYAGSSVAAVLFSCNPVFGSLILLVLILLSHVPALAQALIGAGLSDFANIPIFAGYTLQNLPYVLFVSVGVAGIGFCCYFLAMEYQPASVVSLVYFFKPALAPVLAWMVHGEVISRDMLIGIVLIVAGSLCAIIPGILESKRVAGT